MDFSSLKIVHATSVHRPRDVRILEKECKGLASRGAHVTLVAVHDRDETIDGVALHAIPRAASRWQRMVVTTWRVMRAARQLRPDLIHVHDPELIPWAWWLRFFGWTVVYDMHENVPLDILSKTWLPLAIRFPVATLVKAVERLLLRNVPVVFASPSFAANYRFVRRHTTVLNLPQLELIPTPVTHRRLQPTVAYIGGVARDRGSVVTLEALRILRERGRLVGWECVGPIHPTSHRREMEDFIAQHRLEGVNLRGYLPSVAGWTVIRDCHIGLVVLMPEPNFVPTYPTKLFEYMALGMPVIASNFPYYRQIVEENDCGICVDPERPDELAEAIARLLDDPVRAEQMGRNGRAAIEARYQWATEMAKMCDFYELLLEPRRSGSGKTV